MSEQPFPPTCASRFRPERLLGQGGFGDVWLATQIGLERPVAIKFIRTGADVDAEQLQRFRNEAHVTSRLSHPCIVKVIDHDVEDGVPWIAYEYLPGRSLGQVLAAGPLHWEQAIAVAQQIAGALEEAHDKGVIHRDIKPDNVLEVEPGLYKLADFGIAKWTAPSHVRTKTGFIMGTPTHVPPEQIQGDPASPQGDVYALGVVLYQMLTGRLPFEDESMLGVLRRHLEQMPDTPSRVQAGLPPGVDLLVKQALEKKPAKRFADGGAMKRALEDIVRPGGFDSVARPAEDVHPAQPVNLMSTGRLKRPGVRPDSSTRAVSRSGLDLVPPAPERRGLRLAAVALAVFVLGGAALLASLKPVPRPSPSPSAPPPPERDYTSEIHRRLEIVRTRTKEFDDRARRPEANILRPREVENLKEVVPLMEEALGAASDLFRFLHDERQGGTVWAEAIYIPVDDMLLHAAWIMDQKGIGTVRTRVDGLDSWLRTKATGDVYQNFVARAVAARRISFPTASKGEAAEQMKHALNVLENGAPKEWLSSVKGIRVRQYVAHETAGFVEKSIKVPGPDKRLDDAWRKVVDIAGEVAAAVGEGNPSEDLVQEVLRIHGLQIETAGRVWKATYLNAVERHLAVEQLHDVVRRLMRYQLPKGLAQERDRLLSEAERILRKNGGTTPLADGTLWPPPKR